MWRGMLVCFLCVFFFIEGWIWASYIYCLRVGFGKFEMRVLIEI